MNRDPCYQSVPDLNEYSTTLTPRNGRLGGRDIHLEHRKCTFNFQKTATAKLSTTSSQFHCETSKMVKKAV
jgi:hypothetical protein